MPYDPPPQLGAQCAALRALACISEAHGDLPGAYVVSHSIVPEQIDVQLDAPSDFETWRAALGIDTSAVTLKHYDARRHLEFVTPLGTTRLRVYAAFPDIETVDEGSRP